MVTKEQLMFLTFETEPYIRAMVEIQEANQSKASAERLLYIVSLDKEL